MTTSLDERYFDWLYSQIGAVTDANPNHSYILLAEQLHAMPFVWTIPNDDNRGVDGKDLRQEFLNGTHAVVNPTSLQDPCTMLEMLLALARRCEFDGDGLCIADTVGDWFWLLMDNVGLRGFTDAAYMYAMRASQMAVESIVMNLINREYAPDGTNGGLFPLLRPGTDQRKVEICYQMNAFLLENSNVWL